MSKHWFLVIYSTLVLLLSSCQFRDGEGVATYTIPATDFQYVLPVDGFVEPVNSTNMACPSNIEGVIAFLMEDGVYVESGDLVCVIEVKELETEYDQVKTDLENTKAHLSKTRANLDMQYAMLEAQVKNNEADTQIAQLDSLQLLYTTPSQRKIKELELQKVTIEKGRYEKKLQALAIINQSEIKTIELQIQTLSNQVARVKERLDALTIRSSQKGLAVRSTNPLTGKKFQVGDPVWGNMTIASIPELAKMKVKIFAPEKDYKNINIGDSVNYVFDAMPENKAWGKILMKSPVGQQHKEGSKVKFFEIESSVDSALLIPEPGFTADCAIFLKQIKDTIVIPQIAIFEEDSIKVAYVKKNNGFEMRQIQTGMASPKEAVVTEGLHRREVIALIKPELSLVRSKVLLSDSIAKN